MKSKGILDLLEKILNLLLIMILAVTGIFAGYAVWDDGQIYVKAESGRKEINKIKPEIIEENNEMIIKKHDFSELNQINGDTKGWITINDTNIDYPIVQGSSNYIYLNTDFYGEFALSGSIFMDYRNRGDFSDSYTIIYGHYMNGNEMFGTLSKYKEPGFLKTHKKGVLLTPDKDYNLELIAVLVASSSEPVIFNLSEDDLAVHTDLTCFLENNAIYYDKERMAWSDRILCLSTCSYEFSGARTIVMFGY